MNLPQTHSVKRHQSKGLYLKFQIFSLNLFTLWLSYVEGVMIAKYDNASILHRFTV